MDRDCFFENWNDDEKQVLYYAVLKAYEISVESIIAFLPNSKIYTPELISRILKKAHDQQLLVSTDLWESEYFAGDEFILQVIPYTKKLRSKLTELQTAEEEDPSQPSHNRKAALKRNIAFALLFEKNDYAAIEERLLPHPPTDIVDFYDKMIIHEAYRNYIREIDITMINICLNYRYNQYLSNLYPISEYKDYFLKVKSLSAAKNRKYLYYFDEKSPLFTHDNSAYNEKNVNKESEKFYNRALMALFNKENEKAMSYFSKGLQVEKRINFPQHPIYGLWYFITLYTLSPGTAALHFESIRKTPIENKQSQNRFWLPVMAHFFNDQPLLQQQLREAEDECAKGTPSEQIIFIIVSYLTENRLNSDAISSLSDVVIGCFSAGYHSLALEAAYALAQLTSNEREQELYRAIHDKLQVDPVLSLVKREETWVKNMKLLQSLIMKSHYTSEKSVKISYLFHKEHLNLQLVVHNKTDKGWSKGRKIASKDMLQVNTSTLSSIDQKIISKLQRSAGYSENNIFNVAKEIINHPAVFSDDDKNHPVLFIPGRIEINIASTDHSFFITTKPYIIDSNNFIEEVDEYVYKIYTISEPQKNIIKAIQQNNLEFPISQEKEVRKMLHGLRALDFEIINP